MLEVGCGQGTDAIYCSKLMGSESTYTGIDYSPNSVKQAMENVRAVQSSLPIVPELEVGDGENLRFVDNSFECVSSIGVLHHTQNTVRAINEVARVLKPGGNAYIALYRLYSPKLIFAYMGPCLKSVAEHSPTDSLCPRIAATRAWTGRGRCKPSGIGHRARYTLTAASSLLMMDHSIAS